jgi:hypothetical protein
MLLADVVVPSLLAAGYFQLKASTCRQERLYSLHNRLASLLNLRHSTIYNNSANGGGGVYFGGMCTAHVQSTVLRGNRASDGAGQPGSGGGLLAVQSAKVRCRIC